MIQVESDPAYKFITVHGDVDLSKVRHLRTVFGYVDLASFLVVSFKRDREADSALIELLLSQYDARNGRFIIVTPPGSAVGRMLTIARLHANRLSIVAQRADAVASIELLERLAHLSFASDEIR